MKNISCFSVLLLKNEKKNTGFNRISFLHSFNFYKNGFVYYTKSQFNLKTRIYHYFIICW